MVAIHTYIYDELMMKNSSISTGIDLFFNIM